MEVDPAIQRIADHKSLGKLIGHHGEAKSVSNPHGRFSVIGHIYHVQIIVRACLFSEEGVNSPAAIDPHLDTTQLKGLSYLDHIRCVHHARYREGLFSPTKVERRYASE